MVTILATFFLCTGILKGAKRNNLTHLGLRVREKKKKTTEIVITFERLSSPLRTPTAPGEYMLPM